MTLPALKAALAPRSITLLGATGSIGRNAIDLIERSPERFAVAALTGNGNAELLAAQAKKLGARLAAIASEAHYPALKAALSGTGIKAVCGEEGLLEAATLPSDLVISAIVGAAGLKPTLAAIERGTTVALANKECLVCAGSLMMRAVAKAGAKLIPVDSEHSAIFQVLEQRAADKVEKITITASGGPFRWHTREQMAHATPEEAVKHPKWNMGAKISVDSATMMNKGLELIEAHHLFGTKPELLEILVHPESIVHSLVHYVDGSVLAQLGMPDMRTPIAYALSYPERMQTPVERLNLAQIKQLTFEPMDDQRFPAPKLARAAMETGGAAPSILNAANEVAVARFLKREIGFLDIVRLCEDALTTLRASMPASIADVLEADAAARQFATEWSA